jgi:hypothetical protein
VLVGKHGPLAWVARSYGKHVTCILEYGWRREIDDQCPCFLYIIRPEYVGPEGAREIAEALYKLHASMGTRVFSVDSFHCGKIEKIVCGDVFRVKLDPTTVVRAFTLNSPIEDLEIGTQEYRFPDVTARERVLEPLYRIKKKSGFNLQIEDTQRHIRLNRWHDIFEISRPLLEHFEREGANVCIYSTYVGNPDEYPIQINVTDLVRHHDPGTWKQPVIAKLERVCWSLMLST